MNTKKDKVVKKSKGTDYKKMYEWHVGNGQDLTNENNRHRSLIRSQEIEISNLKWQLEQIESIACKVFNSTNGC